MNVEGVARLGVHRTFRRFARKAPATLVALALAGVARAQVPSFEIPTLDADAALAAFSQQSQLQLVFDYDAVQGIRTHPVSGSLGVADALGRMLKCTGLAFEVVNERTISIVRDSKTRCESRKPARSHDVSRLNRGARARSEDSRPEDESHHLGRGAIDEIVVSAEKRDRSLQRSALAVTALDAHTLENQQPSDLRSLTTLIPNFQIGISSTQAAFDLALRGIVSTNRTEAADPAVAFHVDGFYSPRPQGATMLIHDLERLEVLRGPQGTLFGRNSNAGVINVVTAKPRLGQEFGAIDVTAGSYDLRRVKGHYNLPLGDTFALRASAHVEQRDGYIEFQPGSDVPAGTARYDDSNRLGVRLSGVWEPDDSWSVFASLERFADRGAGTVPVSLRPAPGERLRSALITSPGELDMKNDTLHLRTDYRFSAGESHDLELSYLFGWARMTRENVIDQDTGLALDPILRALPDPPLPATYDEERRTAESEFVSVQHEIQLKPLTEGPLEWIVGTFFYREDNSARVDFDIMDDRGGIPGVVDDGDVRFAQSFIQPNRSLAAWAGFGQLTWHAGARTRFTVGARYTEDTKRDVGGVILVCPAAGATIGDGGFILDGMPTQQIPMSPDPDSSEPVPGTCRVAMHNDANVDWSKVTYTARAEYDFSDALLGYTSTSTGYKSGVIQDGGTHAGPEEVVNYELGLKATLLDGAMAINNVGFFSNYSDILRARLEYDASGFQQLVTRNATRAHILGVESELLWKPVSDGTLQAVFTWLNAEYRDFPTVDTQYYVPTDPLSPVVNLRGNKLPFAPEITGALAYEHVIRLPNGARLVPRLQAKYQSEMFLTDFNRPSDRQSAYTRTDLGLRYETTDSWALEAYVLNLEDEAVKNNVDLRASRPGTGGVPGFPGVARAFFDAPRTYGVRLSMRFD